MTTCLWNPTSANDDDELYERYERVWPRIKKHRLNKYGVYFRRLMAWEPRKLGFASNPQNELSELSWVRIALLLRVERKSSLKPNEKVPNFISVVTGDPGDVLLSKFTQFRIIVSGQLLGFAKLGFQGFEPAKTCDDRIEFRKLF